MNAVAPGNGLSNDEIRILLIDYSVGSRSRVPELLSRSDIQKFNLEYVTTRSTALSSFNRGVPNVCIVDSACDNETSVTIEALRAYGSAPIVVLTSESTSEVLDVMRSGASYCLTRRALSAHQLERSIRYVLNRERVGERQSESAERYMAMIEDSGDVIYTHDLKGNYTSVNRAVERLTGYTRQEILTMRIGQLVAPEYFELAAQMMVAKVKELGQTLYEAEIVNKNGQRVPVSVSSHLIYKDRNPVGVEGIARDISQRREAENALRKNEERYRAFVEHSSEAIWCVQLRERCPINLTEDEQINSLYDHAFLAECNDMMAQKFGFSRAEEIVGTPIAELLPRSNPKNIDHLRAFIRSHYLLKDANSRELDLTGQQRWFLNNLVGTVEDGALLRVWGTQRDVTELKRASQAIEEANERALAEYERLVERIAGLGQALGQARELTTILRAVRDFAIVSVPCDAMLISLYEHDERMLRAVYCWADETEFEAEKLTNIPVRRETTDRAIESGAITIDNELQQWRSDSAVVVENSAIRISESALSAPMAVMGRTVGCIEVQSCRLNAYSREHATAMRMAANLAANAVETVALIRREREKAEQLRQSQKMEAIGQLAGGVAHDFNNLLTAIIGYSDLSLRRLAAADPIRLNLEEIKKASGRATSLTRQLLAFSRKQILQAKTIDLNVVVADVDRMLRRLIGEDIDLVTSLERRPCKIKADPGQIEQVILNLAVNARDAMPKGGKLTIETGHVQLDQTYSQAHITVKSGHYVMLAVSDTGFGMDAETKSRIFEPFFTTKAIGKGTGLGLSTVYGIVKQTEGTVWVYSEPGGGSTFKIYLPIAEELSEAEVNIDLSEAPAGRETILVVEDEEVVRNLTCEILKISGYDVLVAVNGEEACRLCMGHGGEIQLMVTDVVMPQMSGRELAEHVRLMRPKIKVLYMSGYTDDAIVRHGVLEEDMPFLQKPFTPDSLARKVRAVLEGAKAPTNA